MPELPELENTRRILQRTLAGRRVAAVSLDPKGGPMILRDLTGDGVETVLLGATIADVRRRGKFILFELDNRYWMAINPKLSGRLQLAHLRSKATASTLMRLTFSDSDLELRYLDDKRMGQVYLTTDLFSIPTYKEMGPEVGRISAEEFQEQLKRFRGEIKGVLTRGALVAGIGNAYADEILWQAKIHPFLKRTSFKAGEAERLYRAMRATVLEAGHLAREAMDNQPDLKPREFFRVHLRGGEKCPRCGTTISEIRARRKVTNFCRGCQPGGLFDDMDRLSQPVE